MGTNYYIKFKDENLHIGKKSKGWNFVWRAYPEYEIFGVKDWQHFILVNKIESNIHDEYGDNVDIIEFFDKITDIDNNKDHIQETGDESCYYDVYGNIFSTKEFE